VGGDPTSVDILYAGAPYTLNTPIPVVELGHNGCDVHDWHSGVAAFTLVPRNPGQVTFKASVDPDPELCEGDGVPTFEDEVTVTVTVPEYATVEILYKTFIAGQALDGSAWNPLLYKYYAADDRWFT
jgi:hypothetical protein